jgi:hypothetical protein
MSSLNQIFSELQRMPLGDEPDRRQKVRSELLKARSRNERYFIIAVVLLIIFFVTSWVIVFLMRDNPNALGILCGTLGGSVFGCVWAMVRLWQQKMASDIIIVLLEDLPAPEFNLVFQKLIRRF